MPAEAEIVGPAVRVPTLNEWSQHSDMINLAHHP
jgi:hypothetical protein